MSAPRIDIEATGGSGGVSANRDALVAVAAHYRGEAGALQDEYAALRDELHALGNPVMGGAYGGAGALDVAGLLLATAELEQAADQLRACADTFDELGVKLGWAAQGYPWGKTALDVGLLDHVAGLLRGTTVLGLFGDRKDTVAAQDPRTADLAIDLAQIPHLSAMSGIRDDGVGVAVRTGVTPVVAPRSLTDLVDGLASVDRDGTPAGIDVRIVTGADGRRRAIVDITGTRTWGAGGSDPADLATNALAIDGHDTAYEQGVLAALRDAGVRHDEPVMLVGHSQGGMVAVNVAHDASRTHEFTITHVVTAGSPVGLTVGRLPDSIRVLALENRRDVVPRLDGAPNPDRPNVTTVSGTTGDGSVGGSHAIEESYRPIADAVSRDGPRSVRDFLRSADGYFDGDYADQHAYRVERR